MYIYTYRYIYVYIFVNMYINICIYEYIGQFQFESLMYKDDSPKSTYALLNAVQGGGIVVKSGGSLKVEVGRIPYASTSRNTYICIYVDVHIYRYICT
jgi:hypothetical protein